MPRLTNVLYVKRMKENLISMSELCDDDLHLHFDKRRCDVLKEDEECIIIRTRTSNNCYQMNKTNASGNMNV